VALICCRSWLWHALHANSVGCRPVLHARTAFGLLFPAGSYRASLRHQVKGQGSGREAGELQWTLSVLGYLCLLRGSAFRSRELWLPGRLCLGPWGVWCLPVTPDLVWVTGACRSMHSTIACYGAPAVVVARHLHPLVSVLSCSACSAACSNNDCCSWLSTCVLAVPLARPSSTQLDRAAASRIRLCRLMAFTSDTHSADWLGSRRMLLLVHATPAGSV